MQVGCRRGDDHGERELALESWECRLLEEQCVERAVSTCISLIRVEGDGEGCESGHILR